jgi:DNA-binding transcriptional MerR regulator
VRIGELARRTGVSVRSLRYYESHGLLTSRRAQSGQRHYDPDAEDRVHLLRRLYSAGLNSATIASLLPCVDTPSAGVTSESVAVMQREHSRLGVQIAELETTRSQLGMLIDIAHAHFQSQTALPSLDVA